MRWFWLAWLLAGELWDDALRRSSRPAPFGSHGTPERSATFRSRWSIAPACTSTPASSPLPSALIEESDSITAATGYAPLAYASVLLDAWRGDEAKRAEPLRLGGGERDDAGRGTGDRSARLHVRRPVQRTRPLRRGAGRRPSAASTTSSASAASPSSSSSRLPSAAAAPEVAAEALRELEERTARRGHRLGARDRWLAHAPARLRRRRRRALPRGDRAARTQPDRRPPRPCPPAVRRVAAAREPPARRPRPASPRPRHAPWHGRRGVRRARPSRAAGDRCDCPPAHRDHAGRPHPAGSADRPIGRRRAGPTRRSAASCSSARGRSSTT